MKQAVPRRWVAERTFARLMHHRRLTRDSPSHHHRSEAVTQVAMVDLMSRGSPSNPRRTGANPE